MFQIGSLLIAVKNMRQFFSKSLLLCWLMLGCQPEADDHNQHDDWIQPNHAQYFGWKKTGDTVVLKITIRDSESEIVLGKPFQRIVCTSTTQIPFLTVLSLEERVVGIAGSSRVCDLGVRTRIASGKIREVGSQMRLNVEAIIALKPDVVLMDRFDAADQHSALLRKAGIAVLSVPEWQEASPLARTEWIKLYGLAFGKFEEASSYFAQAEQAFVGIAEQIPSSPKPRALVGMGFEGNWYVPKGGSYMAELIRKAGGQYVFAGLEGTGSQQVGFEYVLREAMQADVWLHVGTARTQADILASEPRCKVFPPLQSGRVYNYTKAICPSGGYDYFESAVVHPDWVLRDLAKIFHPKLFQSDTFYYHQLLPSE